MNTDQRLARRFHPAAPGKRLVHTLVIEFRPKELLKRFDPPQPLQQVQNALLSLRFGHIEFYPSKLACDSPSQARRSLSTSLARITAWAQKPAPSPGWRQVSVVVAVPRAM